MPALSESQRRFFGLVLGLKRGSVSPKNVGKEVRKTAQSISEESAREFAMKSLKNRKRSRRS